MAEELKPCPFCGSTSLKHYTRNASQGGYRGVVECRECGARLEAYSDNLYTLSKAYMGDWNEAKVYAQGYAFDAVARKWNGRAERTCRNVSKWNSPEVFDFECSECGAQVCCDEMSKSPMVVDKNEENLRYCPNCGARVVES